MTEIADMNREHFDKEANTYDNKVWVKKIYERLTRELLSRKDWINVPWIEDSSDEDAKKMAEGSSSIKTKDDSRTMRVLDYACGPGFISKTFLPYATSCTGIDISSGMVNLYNERASQQGLEPSEMHAVVGDIAAATPDPNLASPELFDLDLAVVGMGFHHFADPGLAAKRLVERLKKGSGVLLILDFLPHEPIPGHGERQSHNHQHGHNHSHRHSHRHDSRTHVNGDKGEDLVPSGYPKAVTKTVAHHGFSEEMIKRFFTEAGCVDVGIQVLGEGISFGEGDQSVKRKLFLARGTRSEAD